jgi:hypothetical protein
MQGKPIIQWFLFTLMWLLLIIPIVRVTRSQATATSPGAVATETLPVWLSIRFSAPPTSFSVRQDDRVLVSETAPAVLMFDREARIEIDEFGAELILLAELPETDTAVEMVVEPDGHPRQSRTLWLSGSVEEAVSFSWGTR